MYQHTTISKKHQSQTLPPPEPLFSLNFNLFFLEFVIITIWRTIFPKFTTFVFPIDFLVCHFFSSTQPALPSLVVCGCFCQEELQRGEGGRGKYTRHFLETPMGKHSEKSSDFWTRYVFCFFFSKHTFHFWKNNGKHFVFPLMPTFPPRNAALRDWFPPYCRPYFNGGWHDHVMKTCGFARLWWHAQLIQKRAEFGWQNLAPKCTWKLLENNTSSCGVFFLEGLIWECDKAPNLDGLYVYIYIYTRI